MDIAVFASVFMIIFMILFYVPLIALAVLQYVAMWKVLVKMDRPGWWIFVPGASLFIFYDRCWKRGAFWRYVAYAVIYLVGYFVLMFSAIFQSVFYAMGNTNADNGFVLAIVALAFVYIGAIPMIVNLIRMYRRMATCFGKSKGFGWGLALLSPIFILILGFGNAKYLGNPPVQPQYAPPASYLPPQNYPPQS